MFIQATCRFHSRAALRWEQNLPGCAPIHMGEFQLKEK